MGKLTLDYIEKNALWIVRTIYGYRFKGTYAECDRFYEHNKDDVKDFDLCAVQPIELQEFFEALDKYPGFITIKDFYNNIWNKVGA